MKLQVFSAICGLVVAGGQAVMAQDQVASAGTVVELYTSQGCSSCPPADEYLSKLAQEPGVIALALHVDYWDYIGWVDKFGSEKFTKRQRAYARQAKSNTIYTPQMIVGGVDRVEGTDPAMVEGAIRRLQQTPPSVALQLARSGGQLTISAQTKAPLEAPLRVQLVQYEPMTQVTIEHGENAGRVIDYANVVTAWSIVGMWDGQSDLQLVTEVPVDEPVVVILQAEGPGRIFAAAQLK